MRTDDARSCSTVCLAKAHRCRGCKSHPATLAPAGSARGGSGGDEWSEALREKVPSGDQRAIRAAAQANTNEASKGSNVRADPPVEREAAVVRQASETRPGRSHRGKGGSTYGRTSVRNKGSPPDRSTLLTVLRDTFRSRAISLIDLPLTKCSRLIRSIVSTISISHRPPENPGRQPSSH